MMSSLRIAALVLTALPVALALPAQARDGQQTPKTPRDRAAFETAQKFSARLSRLDALMGGVPRGPAAPRARSADAEH